ncbi:MAG: hypothetical protein EOP05_06615 [Proteobacteria bacterium]|nr:MAG: hypothetical protein EOP05_06615 [Pseudomonadota bacterium]
MRAFKKSRTVKKLVGLFGIQPIFRLGAIHDLVWVPSEREPSRTKSPLAAGFQVENSYENLFAGVNASLEQDPFFEIPEISLRS